MPVAPVYRLYVSFIGLADSGSLSGAAFGNETGALATQQPAGDIITADMTVAGADLGGLAAGLQGFVKVRRDGADVNDSAIDDIILLGVEILYDRA